MQLYSNDVLAKSPDAAAFTRSHAAENLVLTPALGFQIVPNGVTTGETFDHTAGLIDVRQYETINLLLYLKTISGTAATLQLFVDTVMRDGSFVNLCKTASLNTADTTSYARIGIGAGVLSDTTCYPGLPGQALQVRAVTTGTGTLVYTASIEVQGGMFR